MFRKTGIILRSLWLSSIFWGNANKAIAQSESTAYNLMLKALYKNTVPTISCAELAKNQNVILLDTRAKNEFDVSHIPNARWVGYEEFDLKSVKDVSKNSTIVVYCSVGYRSERIGEKLLAAGYKNVRNLYGSIFEWVNTKHQVVDIHNKPTQKVHGYSKSWGVWLKKGEKVY